MSMNKADSTMCMSCEEPKPFGCASGSASKKRDSSDSGGSSCSRSSSKQSSKRAKPAATRPDETSPAKEKTASSDRGDCERLQQVKTDLLGHGLSDEDAEHHIHCLNKAQELWKRVFLGQFDGLEQRKIVAACEEITYSCYILFTQGVSADDVEQQVMLEWCDKRDKRDKCDS